MRGVPPRLQFYPPLNPLLGGDFIAMFPGFGPKSRLPIRFGRIEKFLTGAFRNF